MTEKIRDFFLSFLEGGNLNLDFSCSLSLSRLVYKCLHRISQYTQKKNIECVCVHAKEHTIHTISDIRQLLLLLETAHSFLFSLYEIVSCGFRKKEK